MIVWPFTSGALGSSDCEELGDGWSAQPVNAATSSAYVAVGLVVVAAVAVAVVFRPVDRVRAVVYGASVAAIGVGSVLFHGPQPAGSQLAHDLPILLTAWFIVVHDVRLVGGWRHRDLSWWAAGATAATAAAVVGNGAVALLTGVAVAAIVVLEFVIAHRGLRPRSGSSERRTLVAIVVVAAVAAAAWLLGRTDSPLCDPDDVVQMHGLWHLLSATVFGLWWLLAFWLPAGETDTHRSVLESADA